MEQSERALFMPDYKGLVFSSFYGGSFSGRPAAVRLAAVSIADQFRQAGFAVAYRDELTHEERRNPPTVGFWFRFVIDRGNNSVFIYY